MATAYIGERLVPWIAQRKLHPSIGKLWRTIQGWHAAQLAHELGGPLGAAWESDDVDADSWAYHVLNCRTIEYSIRAEARPTVPGWASHSWLSQIAGPAPSEAPYIS